MNLLLQSYFCFFASRGFYPNMNFDIIDLMDTSFHEQISQQEAIYMFQPTQNMWKFGSKTIALEYKSQSRQAVRYCQEIPYNIGKKVWPSTKNINTDQPSKNLDHKMLVLFDIIGKKLFLLELQLILSIKIYNVFHTNLLRKTPTYSSSG